jgi:hypothetical protein
MIFPAQAFDWTSRNGANSLLAKINLLAEREGFEPPVRFPVHLISRDQAKRDRSISKHKFTEENNYPLPSFLRISANLCS